MCRDLCSKYKAQKPVGAGRYASGQRRCQPCEIFIKWEGLWCPCCGTRLRTKPRNIKYKAKLRQTVLKSGEEVVIKQTQYILVRLVQKTPTGEIWKLRNRETSEYIESLVTP